MAFGECGALMLLGPLIKLSLGILGIFMDIKLKEYQKHNSDKLDSVGTGINIEKKHVEFIRKFNINLSSLVRDVLDKLMSESREEVKQNEKE